MFAPTAAPGPPPRTRQPAISAPPASASARAVIRALARVFIRSLRAPDVVIPVLLRLGVGGGAVSVGSLGVAGSAAAPRAADQYHGRRARHATISVARAVRQRT